MDITAKRFVILGLQGSGKTVLARHILSTAKYHLIYDVLNEYDGFRRYVPTDRYSAEELTACIQKLVLVKLKPTLFIIDEANRYMPPKPANLPSGVAEMNDWSRHFEPPLSWGCLCRRPVQLHSDIMELAHYLFIFVLKGKNDRFYLDTILPGLGDIVANLPEYHFAVVTQSRSVSIHSPIAYQA